VLFEKNSRNTEKGCSPPGPSIAGGTFEEGFRPGEHEGRGQSAPPKFRARTMLYSDPLGVDQILDSSFNFIQIFALVQFPLPLVKILLLPRETCIILVDIEFRYEWLYGHIVAIRGPHRLNS
jgi:hypothetical protein